MSKQHGKDTFVSLNGVNLSAYCNNSEFNRSADSHDVTTYGNNSHRKDGGLFDGTATLEGFYETVNVTGGPRRIIEPLIGTVVGLVRRPEGTGAGKAEDNVNVLVVSYNESSPVADMVTWSAELEFDGDVDSTPQ